MGDDKFLLNLNIDGRNYPLRILRSEEQAYRDAAKKINDKINQYRVAFGGDNSGLIAQDYMAMTALQALVDNFSLHEKNYTKPMEDKISQLIQQVDTFLKK